MSKRTQKRNETRRGGAARGGGQPVQGNAPAAPAVPWWRRGWVAAAVLTAAAIFVYVPAMSAGYTWDDDIVIQKNPYLSDPAGLYHFWFTAHATDYFPLTFTVLWFEWRLWGFSAAGYHLSNILFHALGALALWRMLRALGVRGAWGAALLYALHPLCVATVAWVTELKNTLPQALWPWAVVWWVAYLEGGGRCGRRYGAALGFYTAAMLAKTSLVGLPPVLLLCAWWLRGRVTRRDVAAIVPFLGVALALALVTLWHQSHRAIGNYIVRPEGWGSRIACAAWAVWFYLGKVVLPTGLTVVYPRWNVNALSPLAWLPAAALTGVLAAAWRWRAREWARGTIFALASFVLLLFPVLGFFKMAFHYYSLVADHWVYPALIAPVALAVGAAARWSDGRSRETRQALGAALTAVALVFALLSWRRAGLYADSLALWTDNIEKNPQAWVAYGNRAPEWAKRGDPKRQAEDTEHVLQLRPNDTRALVNRARQNMQARDYARALVDLDHALRIEPDRSEALQVRAKCYRDMGDNTRALDDLKQAVHYGTNDPMGLYLDLGETCHNLGRDSEALEWYTRMTATNPRSVEGWTNCGAIYYFLKRYDEAIAAFGRAIEIAPKFETPYRNRAALRVERGDYSGAVADYTSALACPNPATAEALAGRADAYEKLGDAAAAARDREALAQLGNTAAPTAATP